MIQAELHELAIRIADAITRDSARKSEKERNRNVALEQAKQFGQLPDNAPTLKECDFDS